jgi:hypothetical protein
MTSEFDQAARHLLRMYPSLLGWFLGLQPHQLEFVAWLDTQAIPRPGDAPEQVRDTLAHVLDPTRNGLPWVIGAEFQLRPDPDMVSRLMIYLGEARRTLKPTALPGDRFHVGGVVVNLTGRGHSNADMEWPEAGLRMFIQPREIDLEYMAAD